MEVDLTNLNAVLAWLAGPVGAVAWAAFWSDLFRSLGASGFAGLDKLTPLGKQLVYALGTALVPTAAYIVLSVVPTDVIAALAPHYAFAASVLLALLGGRLLYALRPASGKG